MKLDKETIIKNRFWFCLGGFGLAWLIGLLVLMFGASSTIEAKKKEFADSQQQIQSQNNVKQLGPVETNPWLKPWAVYENRYRSHKEVIWKEAWDRQATMITWPSSANSPLEKIWEDSGSMKQWVSWFNRRILVSQTEQTDYKNFLYLAQYLVNPAEPRGPYKLVELVDPVAFKGGRPGFEVMMAPTTGVPATGQSTEGGAFPMGDIGSKGLPGRSATTQTGESQQLAGSGITNFWQQLPTPEEMWLAQEDFWVKRELLTVVRNTLDHISAFTRAKDAPPPQEYAAQHTFKNRNWEITLLIEKEGNTRFISEKSTIKNVDPSRRILSLTDPISKKGIRFELRQGDVNYILTVNGEPLAPGQSITFNRRSRVDTVVLDKPFDLYQKFDWFNSPIRRIDDIKLAYHSHRTANIPLKPSGHFPTEPESTDSEFADPNASPEFQSFEGEPGMVDPNNPGAAAPPTNITPANSLLRDRYVHVTEVCRHLPLAMSIVIEQEHIHTLVTKLVNSPIRFQVTQIQVERATDVLPPSMIGTQPGTAEGTEGAFPMSVPMPFPMPFPMTGSPDGGPGLPGQTTQGNPRLEAGLNNLVRVDLYGIAALYERVPKTTQQRTEGQPADKQQP